MRRNKILYILGLGSNLPIPEKNIIGAIKYISKIKNIKILNYSSYYISEPLGYKNQPIFINCALLIETDIKPINFLKKIKKIEKDLGRVKSFKNGPRKIDIDILLCENLISKFKKLKIPHKKFLKRAFEFLPSLEVAPSFIHPKFNKELKELSKKLIFKDKAYKSIKPQIAFI